MTNTFKPAGAALAAVVAGIAAPATMASEAPALGGAETPAAQADALARGFAKLSQGAMTPFGEAPEPNSALLDVPMGALGEGKTGFG